MKIYGLQKLTLLDYPGKTACTVFTGGCNLRCPFCHNGGLVLEPAANGEIPEEEFFAFLGKRKGILQGVCITGGEPTLAPDLEDFMARVKALGFKVKLDTNGMKPKVLRSVLDKGLADYVAMDIKNCPEKYAVTAGLDVVDISAVKQSVDMLISGGIPFEFRTTLVKELHTAEDIRSLTRFIKGAKRYFLQPYVDSFNVLSPGFSRHSDEELSEILAAAREIIPETELRGV